MDGNNDSVQKMAATVAETSVDRRRVYSRLNQSTRAAGDLRPLALGRRVRDLANAFADALGGWLKLSGVQAAAVRRLIVAGRQEKVHARQNNPPVDQIISAACRALSRLIVDCVGKRNLAQRLPFSRPGRNFFTPGKTSPQSS